MPAQNKLNLTPRNEIVFKGPFEHVVTSYLEIANPTQKQICFKIKTTAPRRYCVRPNSGVVEPDGKIKVAIMLQPIEAESQSERNKHKFMVQSILIDPFDQNVPTDEIWQRAGPEDIADAKLRCVFQDPDQEQQDSLPAKGGDTEMLPDVVAAKATMSSSSSSSSPSKVTTSSSQKQQQQNQNQQQQQHHSMQAATEQAEQSTRSIRASGDGRPKLMDTSSFHQMSDDYKILLVSLAMLIVGVILGKYII